MVVFDELLKLIIRSICGVHYVWYTNQYYQLEWMLMHRLDLNLDLECVIFGKTNV